MESNREAFTIRFGRFIRFSHTVFALPFALAAMLVAARGLPRPHVLILILICMVAARSAAMLFNRLADWELDKQNPRTSQRHKLIGKSQAKAAMYFFIVVFVLAASLLNVLCAALSPVAVLLICFYSLTKRFTVFSHLFLGIALAAAPMGAWAAVTGALLDPVPWILALGVMAWVFGFDLIYATLDVDFDRSTGFYSFPARYGIAATLVGARLLHCLAAVAFGIFGFMAQLSWGFAVAWLLSLGAFVWEHRISRSERPEDLNKAFFQANAFVGAVLLIGVCVDVFRAGN